MYLFFEFFNTQAKSKDEKVLAHIYVDYLKPDVKVFNYTDDIFCLPFGVNQSPTIEDFDEFLESRCVPRTRSNIKELLSDIGLDFYEPLEIIMRIGGYQCEDNFDLKYIKGVGENEIFEIEHRFKRESRKI